MATRENPFPCKTRAIEHSEAVIACTWELTCSGNIVVSCNNRFVLLKVLICQWYVSGTKKKVVRLSLYLKCACVFTRFKKYNARVGQIVLPWWFKIGECQRGAWSSYYFPLFLSRYWLSCSGLSGCYKRTQRCGKNCDHFTQSQFLARFSGTFYVATQSVYRTFYGATHLGLLSRKFCI